MSIEIANLAHEIAYGAVAGTIQENVKGSQPVHGVILTMQFLEATSLPSISDVVTQIGSAITIKTGGAEVFSLSGADLHHLLGQAMPNSFAMHQCDGTGADNHVMSWSVFIPFAPFNHALPIHPEFGLDPTKEDVVVQVEYPADANEIDNRLLDIEIVSITGKTPNKYIERLTRRKTLSATGWGQYEELPSGSNVFLYDLYFFQTTALTDGTTTDAVGIERLSLQINKTEFGLKKVHTKALQMLLGNISSTAGVFMHPAQYIYWPLNLLGEFDMSIPLKEDARFEFDAGVAEAIRTLCGIIRPL